MNEPRVKEINYKGIKAFELSSGGYYAIAAPTIGCNVIRLRDNEKKMEILRYSEDTPISELAHSPFLWGLQPLYPQNRFEDGVIKTSDSIYHLPINEGERNNHIHGFIHDRVFKVKETGVKDGKAFLMAEYEYDENDIFYNYLPLPFNLKITAELSNAGLSYTMEFINKADKVLPMSAAAHTAINAAFVDVGVQEDILLELPVSERVIATDERWLPTGEFSPLDDYDMLYKNGKMRPILRDINNNHYRASVTKLNGKDFHGCIITDTKSNKKICYETDEKFKFWVVWNQGGFKGYFCPEPLTAMLNAPNIDLPRDKTGYYEVLPGETYTLTQRIFTVC